MDRSIRVLYIEDDASQRRQLAEALTSRAFDVHSASSGEEGLAWLRDHRADVALCDLHLPGIDGLAVMARCRETQQHLPFIILTGQGSIDLGVAAIKQGAHHFLTKPPDLEQLDVHLRQAAKHADAERQADEQLHKIVEASPVPLIVTRLRDGEILFANERLGDLLGVAPDELVHRKPPGNLYHAEDRQHVVEQLERHGYLKNHELQLTRPDGSAFWAILSVVKVEIDGEPAVIGGIHDISQRKASEEALSWERNFVSAILDTAGAIVLVLDRDGEIVRTNKAFQRTTRYSFAEVQGQHVWDLFVPPEEREASQRVFHRMKAGDFPHTDESCWLTRDGSRRLISWSNTALVDAEGVVEYIIATGIDVTGQRQAEQKRRLYRELFLNASDAIVISDNEGRIVERNPAHRVFSGYSDDDLYGKPLETFFGEEAGALLRRAITDQGSYRGELTIQTRERELRHVDLSFFPIWGEDGQLLCFASMGRNVTDRKLTEAALLESEETFRSISAAAQDAIIMLDSDSRVTVWNRAAECIFGWPMDEARGRPVHEFLAPERYVERYREGFAKFRGSGQGPVVGETVTLWANRRDGGEIPIELSVSAIERNGQWNAIGIVRDITDRRRAEQELKDKQAQLVQAEKMASLGVLVAGIAHEINTPIGAVNSVHDTLVRSAVKLRAALEQDFPEQYRSSRKIAAILSAIDSANQVIASGTARLINIVSRLKSFARLDEAELKEVDLHEGLEDTLTIIHHEIKHKAEVVRRYGDLPSIRCYPGPINQVFLNLLINASQAIRDRGQITISTRVQDDMVVVQIADDGEGIAPEHLKRIFDPGFTTKGVGVGTGLGLSICYQIIHDHHGEIRVESEAGKGTTFTVELPTRLDELIGERVKG